MLAVKKQIVTDEAMRPVSVLIDYQDWQKIDKLLDKAQEANKESSTIPKVEDNSVATKNESPEKIANSNQKKKSDRVLLPPAITEVQFTLSMLPEIPGIHREEAENKAKEAYVMTLLRHHDISAGRAAELLGINRWELSELMDDYDICPFAELTAEELKREVAQAMLILDKKQK